MPTPSEKLAESLEVLHKLQNANGAAAIRARDLTRTHRERLLKNGFLQEVMKGWYIPSLPDDGKGESTAWYASFWRFAAAYLEHRFHKNWSLSPEQSLSIHVGNGTVPRQLAVRSPKGTNSVTKLPHGTSLFDLQAALPPPADRIERDGLRLYGLEAALIEASPRFFMNQATDARSALAMIRDASDLLGRLLDGGHSTIAGRLAGGLRNCGRSAIADEIIAAMIAAGYAMRESDPFSEQPVMTLPPRETSPYVNRIKLLWQKMRGPVIEAFPHAPGLPRNKAAYMKGVEAAYVTDAYHSLSIEGYRVTASLIERCAAEAIPRFTNTTASSATPWPRAGIGRPSNSSSRASARCSREKTREASPSRITGLGIERCSRRAWRRAYCGPRTLPVIAMARFLSATRCTFR